MQLTDLPRFKQLLTGVGVLYGEPVPELLLDTWWNALEDLEFEAIKTALEKHVLHPDKGQFMPKPADVMVRLQGSTQSQAVRAWALVARAIREVGAYESVQFADPLIHAIIRDMGGWIALCHGKVSELPFRAREFEKHYQALWPRPPGDCPRQLTGLFEQQNRLGGYRLPTPVWIGPPVSPSTSLETL